VTCRPRCSTGSPDETGFYPGHDKDSLLGTERPSIPEWLSCAWVVLQDGIYVQT
jgi:hypothetical protein